MIGDILMWLLAVLLLGNVMLWSTLAVLKIVNALVR